VEQAPAPRTRPDRLRGPLSVLSSADVGELLALGRRRPLQAGEVLVGEGQHSSEVYVVLAGRVRVLMTARDGREILVGVRGAGEVLGELAALDPAPRSATVSALEVGEAVVIPGGSFSAFLQARPPLMLAMLRSLSRRLRDTDRQLVERNAEDATTRLARSLLELAARYGVVEDGGVRLDVPLSQQELANGIGASREAVNAILARWRDAGIVTTGRMRITLLDLRRLRGAATDHC
jgi:CRP/FNR family cyclic AMP-dependent transcriptional regulator